MSICIVGMPPLGWAVGVMTGDYYVEGMLDSGEYGCELEVGAHVDGDILGDTRWDLI